MRLNANVRQEIARNATAAFREREQKLHNTESVLAIRCYNAVVPLKLRKAIEQVQELAGPRNYFDRRNDLRFNVAGQAVTLRTAENVLLVAPHRYQAYSEYVGTLTLTDHKDLVEAVRAWQGDMEKYKTEHNLALRTLTQLLKGVGSTDSLFKVWPEGKKFYSAPPLTPVAVSGVPAVQVQALNTMLGLV